MTTHSSWPQTHRATPYGSELMTAVLTVLRDGAERRGPDEE